MSELTTTARGDHVAYDRHGSGPGLVFISGAGPFRATDPVTTATAEALTGATTIVYDRLGRGESAADGKLGLDRELAAIAALIEVAGGSAVVCGHSSGCSIALAAADAGLPVTGLVLWEAPLGDTAEATAAWIAEVERRMDAGDLVGALAHYMKDMPAEWRDAATSDPEAVAQVVSYRADGESLVWAEALPYAERFSKIRVPTLCLVGVETFPGMPEAADAIATAIPGAESRAVPGAYHTWDVGPMARLLSEFVAGVAVNRVG
jgi:pimeloyl-ACP methyl ester carboxylesterase